MGYLIPQTMEDAIAALAIPGVSVIAGGTDWYPSRGDALPECPTLDVTGLPGFRGISRTDAGWRIGAATRWSDIAAADLPPAFDGLRGAAREVGSVQIQNAGTIGGNLCNASPAADGVPPLLTLDASVELISSRGVRTLPLATFLTGVRRTALASDELLSAILIPGCDPAARAAFLKLGARRYLVISIAMVSVLLVSRGGVVAEARIAVGACSAVAQRLPALEAVLTGCAVDDLPTILPGHLAPLTPIADVRGSAEYRGDAAGELISRAIAAALAKGNDNG